MFWERFVELCNTVNKSPNAVAKDLGYSSAIATKWKNGAVPRYATLMKIADYFDVSTDYLLANDPATLYKSDNVIRVPVFGSVAAGIPIEAIEDIEDYEELRADEYGQGEYFALKIKGQSMEPRMLDGDVVIVRRQEDVDTGEIAIVLVNGDEATCKKIKKTPEGVFLLSTNPAWEPMFYSNKEIIETPVRIIGKVVELRGKF